MNDPVIGNETGAHAGAHVLPVKVLVATAGLLFLLTTVTVAASLMDLGRMNIVVALAIATVKATAVALWFMHLRYGGRFHVVVLVGCALFAALMVAFIVFDTSQYQPDIRAHETQARPR